MSQAYGSCLPILRDGRASRGETTAIIADALGLVKREAQSRKWRWLSSGSEARFVTSCLALGLFLRLAFTMLAVGMGNVKIVMDEVVVARNLRAGLGFSVDYYKLFGTTPEPGAFFPPLYVYNVYLLDEIFGSNWGVILQNVALSLGVMILMYVLARKIVSADAARLTLVLAIFYPPFILRITHGSPLYFKMFLMMTLVMVALKAWEKPSRGTCALAGAVAGAVALAMPDVLAYAALLCVALLFKGHDRGQGFVLASYFALASLLVMAPWTMRNWVQFNAFCLVSSNGGFNFYMGNNPDTRQEVFYRNISDLDSKLGGELARADEFGRDRILYREGIKYIVAEPARAVSNMLTRGLMHWSFRPTNLEALSVKSRSRTYSSSYVAYLWLYVLAYCPLLCLAVVGAWKMRRKSPALVPIYLACLYSTLIAAIFVVQTKQRLMKVEPLLFPLAAQVLVLGRNQRSQRLDPTVIAGRMTP